MHVQQLDHKKNDEARTKRQEGVEMTSEDRFCSTTVQPYLRKQVQLATLGQDTGNEKNGEDSPLLDRKKNDTICQGTLGNLAISSQT